MTKIDDDMNVIEDDANGISKANDAEEIQTFATEDAPWVGAEAAFRQSLLPLPHEDAELYPLMVFGESPPERPRDSITDHEFETIVTSMAPPRLTNKFLTSATAPGGVLAPLRIVSYVVVASLAAVLGWVIIDAKGSVRTPAEVGPTQGNDVAGELRSLAADPAVLDNSQPVERALVGDEGASVEDGVAVFSECEGALIDGTGPVRLDYEVVKLAMEAIAPEVEKCRRGRSGRISMSLQVSGRTGLILSAAPVDASEVGDAAARCIESVLEQATFPRFASRPETLICTFDL